MPISFVYDLYNPFTPERPEIEEEARVAAGPVEFRAAYVADAAEAMAEMAPPHALAAAAPQRMGKADRKALRDAAPVVAESESLGELFQYNITTPVSVGRGQSAMVPIISADLPYRKQLLYNGSKLAAHPVATLRLRNDTGLTLERGPATVIEDGEYVGEAIVPYTAEEGELIIPYSVELDVRVRENSSARREIHNVFLRGAYLVIEEWEIRATVYQATNQSSQVIDILVEHPRLPQFDLHDTPSPAETSDEFLRFALNVPARGEQTLRVQMRRLLSRREQLQRQSYDGLRRYLSQGLLARDTHDRLVELLRLWEAVAQVRERLQEIDGERKQLYEAQQQIQGNMQALSSSGKEGALRTQYVGRLEASEVQLQSIAQEEQRAKERLTRLQQEIEQKLAAMESAD